MMRGVLRTGGSWISAQASPNFFFMPIE